MQHLWHSHPEANLETCLAQRNAGLLASQQHAFQEACEFFARAESCSPPDLENTAECAEAYGYACYLTGRFPQALALLPARPWTTATWGEWTAAVKEATGRKGKDLFRPLRRALTGRDAGPEMADVMPLLRKVPNL